MSMMAASHTPPQHPETEGNDGSRRHRGRASAALCVCTAISLLVAGCGSNSDSGSQAASSPAAPTGGCASESSDTRLGSQTSIPIPSAVVTVTDPGAAPTRIPTLTPDLSSPQQVELSTSSTADQSSGASTTQTVQTPLTARFACDDPADLSLVLGTPTSTEAELSQQLAAAAGSQGAIAFTAGGSPVSLRLAPTEASSAPARRALEQSLVQALQNSIALPTTAIGVGATWRSERTITAAATVVQTVTARLTKWEGSRLTIDVTADESPVNSVFTIPDSGATLTISRYTYTGSGQVTIDLSRGLPVAGSIDYTGARELEGADPQQPLLQRLAFSLTWK